jgi:hypothetical protein
MSKDCSKKYSPLSYISCSLLLTIFLKILPHTKIKPYPQRESHPQPPHRLQGWGYDYLLCEVKLNLLYF